MLILFDMSIYTPRSGSALQKVQYPWHGNRKHSQMEDTSYLPAPASVLFLHSLTSLHQLGRQKAVLPSSCARGCCLHGSAGTWTDYLFQITFPCSHIPIYLRQLPIKHQITLPHTSWKLQIFHKEAQSPFWLWEQRPQMKGLEDISLFSPFTSCWPDAFQVHQDHF